MISEYSEIINKLYPAGFDSGVCVTLPGGTPSNFKNHINEFINGLGFRSLDQLHFVDWNFKAYKSLMNAATRLCGKVSNQAARPHIKRAMFNDVLEDLFAKKVRVRVADYDGIKNFDEDQERTIKICSENGVDIINIVVAARLNIENNDYLQYWWEQYNNKQKQWDKRNSKHSVPAADIQRFAVNNLAKKYGYDVVYSRCYRGGSSTKYGMPMLMMTLVKEKEND